MSDITKCLTDINDKKMDIISSELQYHYASYKKINIYNRKIKIPLQKIWIKTPTVKIFGTSFNRKMSKSNQLTVLLSPNMGEIKSFYFFIKRLEKKIKPILKTMINEDVKFRSCLSKKDNFDPLMNINMPCEKIGDCHEYLFQIYNQYNKRILINELKNGSYTSSFIELSEVWIKDNKAGINWNVLQLKVYPEFNFTKCYFDNDVKEEVQDKNNECFHCLYCPNAHVRTHYCNNTNNNNIFNKPQILNITKQQTFNKKITKQIVKKKEEPMRPISFMISKDALLDIKSKLKKSKIAGKKGFVSDFVEFKKELNTTKSKLVPPQILVSDILNAKSKLKKKSS